MKRCLACSEAFAGDAWRCPSCGHEPGFLDGIAVHAPDLVDGDGTDADYPLDALVRAEDSHFWFRSRSALISAIFAEHFPHARSFMEIGAGGGGVLLALQRNDRSLRIVGSEILVRRLHDGRKRMSGLELIQMDARRIPYVSEFDAVGAFDVIEHIDDDAAVLAQMRDALVPGGGVIVSVPQHPWLWSAFDDVAGHRRRYTRDELMAKMRAAGFDLLRVTSFTTVVLPLLALARMWRRHAKVDLAQEVAIPPRLVNQVLLRIGALERTAIRAGISLPAGGSLLAVGIRRS